EIVAAQRLALVPFALVALAVSLLTAVLRYFWVVRPLLRAARAADPVRLQRAGALALPDRADRGDETRGRAGGPEPARRGLPARPTSAAGSGPAPSPCPPWRPARTRSATSRAPWRP